MVRCAHIPLPRVGRPRQLGYPMVNQCSSSSETPARGLLPSGVMTLFFGAKRMDEIVLFGPRCVRAPHRATSHRMYVLPTSWYEYVGCHVAAKPPSDASVSFKLGCTNLASFIDIQVSSNLIHIHAKLSSRTVSMVMRSRCAGGRGRRRRWTP